MAVPPHLHVDWRGIFVGTNETWSHGLNLRHRDDPTRVKLNDLVGAWATMAQGILSGGVQLTDVRVYRIGSNGRMIGNPHVKMLSPEEGPRGNGTGLVYPSQIALAVTLEGPNRGPARFGRFYLPGPNMALQADGRMSESHQTIALGFLREFLFKARDSYDLLGGPDVVDLNPINVSTLGNDGAGTYQEITRVGLGRVFDTQRRRRRSLDEARTFLSLT